MLISSQQFRDESIIEDKRNAGDYTVLISPVFVVDGVEMQVVMDGHHSYDAAIADGVDPVFVTATAQTNDSVLLLESGVDAFLESQYNDCDWYDIKIGKTVF